MSTKPAVLRAEPHSTVGTVVLRDAGAIVERWAKRAVEEQPTAKRVHQANAFMYRRLGLDTVRLDRFADTVGGLLVGGKALTPTSFGSGRAALAPRFMAWASVTLTKPSGSRCMSRVRSPVVKTPRMRVLRCAASAQ